MADSEKHHRIEDPKMRCRWVFSHIVSCSSAIHQTICLQALQVQLRAVMVDFAAEEAGIGWNRVVYVVWTRQFSKPSGHSLGADLFSVGQAHQHIPLGPMYDGAIGRSKRPRPVCRSKSGSAAMAMRCGRGRLGGGRLDSSCQRNTKPSQGIPSTSFQLIRARQRSP